MLWTNFSTADILIVISISVNIYYTMKLFNRLDQRIKALEDRR